MGAVQERARTLLECLGYAFADGDEGFLSLCADRVEEAIVNSCNAAAVPEGLSQTAAGWTAAEFLEGKMRMGTLEGIEGFDYEAAVQQIQEGDTTVRYFEQPSAEARLEGFIARMKPEREALLAHRRIRW